MTIKIKPSELITRFLWDKYKYFCLDTKSTAEINDILEKDEEFEISEEDAFVINLTNVIYTTELLYKFKQFILSILTNKSFEHNDTDGKKRVYINKHILLQSPDVFVNKFPKNWKSDDIVFNIELERLIPVYTDFINKINELDFITVQDWPCVKIAQVKKVLKKL
jgi:hypothetical protein